MEVMNSKVFIIAGEASGDTLGAALMQDMRALDGTLHFAGVGGPQMIAQGMSSLFPMSDLSIMGLAEVVKHLPLLVKRFNQTVNAILKQNPDILVTVDAPDFCLRVAKKIKKLRPDIKIVHYVAPTVWAWRPGRAKKIAQFLDGLLCLFPFEPPYFTVHGLKAEFVGHPLTKLIAPIFDAQKNEFRVRHNLKPDAPLLCVLPGSRKRELESLVPVMAETIARLKKMQPDLQVIVPTLPHLTERLSVLSAVAHVFVPQDNQEKYVAFATSNAALHASGTVALELALCGTPMVTIYKLSKISHLIAQRLIKTPFANLVNILLRHPVVPELLQDEAEPQNMAAITHALLSNKTLSGLQKEQLEKIPDFLKENTPSSGARFVLGK